MAERILKPFKVVLHNPAHSRPVTFPQRDGAPVVKKMSKLAYTLRECRRWVKLGLRMTSRSGRKARFAKCAPCEHFKPVGMIGLRECQHDCIGCNRIKIGLANSACPKGEWSAEVN